MRKMAGLLALLLALAMAGMSACAENELRGYEKKNGYVYVTLGSYYQSIETGNAKAEGGAPEKMSWTWYTNPVKSMEGVTVHKDPLLWRVLTVDEEKAYLASEYVLFAMPMHVNYTEYKTIGKDFGQTELSQYLNGTFAQEAFTEEELDMLLPCETFGRVFLLDSADVKNKGVGMGTGEGLKCWGTEYAIRVTGLYVFQKKYGAHSAYWVRNQSTTDLRHARCTKDGGQLGHIISDRENEGARPAVYLDMNAFSIAGGSGTKADPYQLVRKEAE